MLTDWQNKLQIDSLQAVECLKLWDRLQMGLTEIVDTGAQLEAVDDKEQQDGDNAADDDMDVETM